MKYHDNVNVQADNVLISAEQVTRVNLLLDIIQTVIIAICNNGLTPPHKFSKIIYDFTTGYSYNPPEFLRRRAIHPVFLPPYGEILQPVAAPLRRVQNLLCTAFVCPVHLRIWHAPAFPVRSLISSRRSGYAVCAPASYRPAFLRRQRKKRYG